MVENLFREDFQREISSSLYWFNEPKEWKIERGSLVIKPEKTDFWQKTHYALGSLIFFAIS